jgi:hypothetical protein
LLLFHSNFALKQRVTDKTKLLDLLLRQPILQLAGLLTGCGLFLADSGGDRAPRARAVFVLL